LPPEVYAILAYGSLSTTWKKYPILGLDYVWGL